jgi:hypothetical protein
MLPPYMPEGWAKVNGAGEAHLDKREKDANILYKYLKNH